MEKLYLYFDGKQEPVMTFSMSIIETIYDWCRSMAMTFVIDGYCFRPYNNTPRAGEPDHMETWNKEKFVEIFNK